VDALARERRLLVVVVRSVRFGFLLITIEPVLHGFGDNDRFRFIKGLTDEIFEQKRSLLIYIYIK
jgi:hypothetical protein